MSQILIISKRCGRHKVKPTVISHPKVEHAHKIQLWTTSWRLITKKRVILPADFSEQKNRYLSNSHLLFMKTAKRKQWSDVSMAGVQKEGKGLRETARLYNLPVESLRRWVIGSVKLNCRPGPSTELTEEEEERAYEIQMSEMGCGISREGVMGMAYIKRKRSHPFREGSAGRAW